MSKGFICYAFCGSFSHSFGIWMFRSRVEITFNSALSSMDFAMYFEIRRFAFSLYKPRLVDYMLFGMSLGKISV